MAASLFVAILDGVGLSMFLPLLQAAEGGGGGAVNEDLGGMAFVLEVFPLLGLPISLVSILFVMLIFFCLKGVAKYYNTFYQVILQQRFTNILRLRGMRLLSGYSYAEFSKADSGRIQNSFSGEIGRVTSGFRFYFLMLQHIVMLTVYVGLAGLANPQFAVMVGIGGIISNLAFRQLYSKTKFASKEFTLENHAFQGLLIQAVAGFKYLKATNIIQDYREKVEKSIVTLEQHQRKMGTLNAIATAMREPIIIFVVVASILVQVSLLGSSLGPLILSLLFLYRGLNSLVGFQTAYNNFLSKTGALENNVAFEEELLEGQEVDNDRAYPGLQRAINLQGVDYSYGHEEVLRDITLTIPKNKTIGIVGGSGAGKTTLVNIICGLLNVEPGMMTVDGVDSNHLNLEEYRSKIGYVTQEAHIFSDTIFNNVSCWDPPTADVKERVWEALRLAHAVDFVEELPEGVDTVVGINGLNLSGGQRQRVSIARELYRHVDILIMDEATSALDSQSEKSIQENIDSLSGKYTMFVIAHRLSTIRHADLIIFLEPGGHYRMGTFEELQEVSPSFRHMVELQTV